MARILPFLAVLLAGCAATSPFAVSMMSDDELRAQPLTVLCNAYYVSHSPHLRQVIQDRTRGDAAWTLSWKYFIDTHQVTVGMPLAAAICAVGQPDPRYGQIEEPAPGETVLEYKTCSMAIWPNLTCTQRSIQANDGVVTAINGF